MSLQRQVRNLLLQQKDQPRQHEVKPPKTTIVHHNGWSTSFIFALQYCSQLYHFWPNSLQISLLKFNYFIKIVLKTVSLKVFRCHWDCYLYRYRKQLCFKHSFYLFSFGYSKNNVNGFVDEKVKSATETINVSFIFQKQPTCFCETIASHGLRFHKSRLIDFEVTTFRTYSNVIFTVFPNSLYLFKWKMALCLFHTQ